MSWECDRPLTAVSGLVCCSRGSIFTFLLSGLILSLSGEGVNTWLMQEEDGGVSLRVSLFLGEVLVCERGSRSLEPLFWDMAASLARCICCLRGELMSGEKVSGTCLRPRAWMASSSGLTVCPNESSKLLPDNLLLSGTWSGELSRT